MTNKEQLEEYLKKLPIKWREQFATLLCKIKEDMITPSCSDVQDCETITSLSEFTTSGNNVSITYKDENGINFTRSFSISDILNNTINLQPNCLTDVTTWSNLTFAQKIQLLIDSHCACCNNEEFSGEFN